MLPACGIGKCLGETPVPKLSSVTPSAISLQNLPVGLTLRGSGFLSRSTAYVNSVTLSSITQDSHHISATVTWQDLSATDLSTGMVYISVVNTGQMMGGILGCPNGGTTKAIAIPVQ